MNARLGTHVKLACYALNMGAHNPPVKPVRTLLFHQWFNTHKKSSVVQITDTNLKEDRIKRQDCAYTPESRAYREGSCLAGFALCFTLILFLL